MATQRTLEEANPITEDGLAKIKKEGTDGRKIASIEELTADEASARLKETDADRVLFVLRDNLYVLITYGLRPDAKPAQSPSKSTN